MFTGIVEDLGTVTAITAGAESARLGIRSEILSGSALGDSISVNGVDHLIHAALALVSLAVGYLARGSLTTTAR